MIARVYTTQERSFQFIEHVAIAIRLIRETEGQQHVGIFHRDETTKDLRMIHLAWHHDLKNSQPNTSYVSFEEISPLAKEILAKLKNWQPLEIGGL